MEKPYDDINLNENEFIRVFHSNTAIEELVWHRDLKDREVRVVKGVGWKLQMDDCLPSYIHEGDVFQIPAMKYHRILKGVTDLILEIKEQGIKRYG